MAHRRPNLVLFNPDQWRGDMVGLAGCRAPVTPNLDALARGEARYFRQAYCQNPVCTPSRCSFMTGWYPHTRGHRIMHYLLRPEEPMLLRDLKQSGYRVWWGGKNDLVADRDRLGEYCDEFFRPAPEEAAFNEYDDSSGWRGPPGAPGYYSFLRGPVDPPAGRDRLPHSDWARVRAAVRQIEEHRPDRDPPFCLFLALSYPHPPYVVERSFFEEVPEEALPTRLVPRDGLAGKATMLRELRSAYGLAEWPEERWRELRRTYLAMVRRVDAQLGLIVEALRRRDLFEDTALLVWSDHGDYTGDYDLVEKTQNTFEDCLTRVPLCVKPPGRELAQAGACDALVELVDIAATVYDYAEVRPQHTHFGRSLRPLVRGGGTTHRDAVFCEGGRLGTEFHTREMESPGSHQPQALYYPRLLLQATHPVAHGKAIMCRTPEYKYVYRLQEAHELYDLRRDPGELENRVDDPALRETARTLRERILRWLVETGDCVPHQLDRRW